MHPSDLPGTARYRVPVVSAHNWLVRKAAPERKERLSRDAERGVIECALRYADSHPDSLRGRWLPGLAEIGTGSFKFQPDYIDNGEREG